MPERLCQPPECIPEIARLADLLDKTNFCGCDAVGADDPRSRSELILDLSVNEAASATSNMLHSSLSSSKYLHSRKNAFQSSVLCDKSSNSS
jgi:hypothetical protein